MNGRHEIESRREEIASLCREHEVARLVVFGSVLRDDFNPETSDVDFLVEFLPHVNKGWAAEYWKLREALEALFGRKVDLGSLSRPITNPYLAESINSSKELLYAA